MRAEVQRVFPWRLRGELISDAEAERPNLATTAQDDHYLRMGGGSRPAAISVAT